MENKNLHVVRLSQPEAKGTAPVRLSSSVSRTSSPQVVLAKKTFPHPESFTRERISASENLSHKQVVSAEETFSRTPTTSNSGRLYYPGFVSKFAVLLLIPMLLVYPLVPVYAADEESAPVPVGDVQSSDNPQEISQTESVESVVPPVSETQPDAIPATESDGQTPPTEGDTSTANQDSTLPNDTIVPPVSSSTPTSGETGVGTTTASTTESTDGNNDYASSTESATSTPNATSSPTIIASSTPGGAMGSSTLDISASSTDEVDQQTEEVLEQAPPETPEQIASRLVKEKEELLRNELRKEIVAEFTKGCVTMDTVGYYCLKNQDSYSRGDIATVVSGVQSSLGSHGAYKQIFMTKGDVTTEITADQWDNAFPTTDVSGKSIVWQGNVNQRWQIFFANASSSGTPVISQLTHSTESNFNPRVDGQDIVWQAWVDGNWEIYFAQHLEPGLEIPEEEPLPFENERLGIDRSWHVERITNNTEHDMFPSISGGLITWQAFENGTWNISAYSLKTKTIVKLSRDGAKSENPRFSITWDERSPDGNTRMMGYDIATGKVVDITGEARLVPDDTTPYEPKAPISQPNQAALPTATSTATTTSSRGDDGDGAGGNGLEL